ncbi:unnamed protein product [Albugo candida]|uniref:Uncharacterized protein n=1 Tax=Albugo candida TaxID=65357 RepID=A0A024GHH1_9STRA|nr:unnamed protein product [Albugo candida]|eukprot:CCI46338.1 unnamed protein product [Albugo candida]
METTAASSHSEMLSKTFADSDKFARSQTALSAAEGVSVGIGGTIVNHEVPNINALSSNKRNDMLNSFSSLKIIQDAKADAMYSASRDLLQMRKVEEELRTIENIQSRQPGPHNEGGSKAPRGRFEQLHEDLLQYTPRKINKCTRRHRMKKQRNKARAEAYEGKQINRMNQKNSKKVTRRKTYYSC